MNEKLKHFKTIDQLWSLCKALRKSASIVAEKRWNNENLSGWIFSYSVVPCKFHGETYYCPETQAYEISEPTPPGNWTLFDREVFAAHFSVKGCHNLTTDTMVLCIRKDGIYRHKVGQCDLKH